MLALWLMMLLLLHLEEEEEEEVLLVVPIDLDLMMPFWYEETIVAAYTGVSFRRGDILISANIFARGER